MLIETREIMNNDYHQQLINEIVHYCEDEKSRYAVAIEGAWGSGKTWFIEKQLRPLLKKKKKYVIRVSLFGLSNAKELYERILAEFVHLGGKTNKKKRIALKESLKQVSNVLLSHGSLSCVEFNAETIVNLLISNKHLIVLDDTERRSEKCDDLSLFGVVNDLIESRKSKIIFISSTTSQENKQGKQFDLDIKEKLIWKTLLYQPNTEEIIDNIFGDLPSNRNSIDVVGCIHKATQLAQCNNIRTMQKSKLFIEQVSRTNVFSDNNLALKNRERAFIDVVQLTLEICENKIPVEPEKWDPDASNSKKRKDLPIIELYNKYVDLPCIKNFYCPRSSNSKTVLEKELRQYIAKRYPNSSSTEELIDTLDALKNIMEMSDSEVIPLAERLTAIIREASFPVTLLPEIIVWNHRLSEWGFKNLPSNHELEVSCKSVISKNVNSAHSLLKYRGLNYSDDSETSILLNTLSDFIEEAFRDHITSSKLLQVDYSNEECGNELTKEMREIIQKDKGLILLVPPALIVKAFSLSSPKSQMKIRGFTQDLVSYIPLSTDQNETIDWLSNIKKQLIATKLDGCMPEIRKQQLIEEIDFLIKRVEGFKNA